MKQIPRILDSLGTLSRSLIVAFVLSHSPVCPQNDLSQSKTAVTRIKLRKVAEVAVPRELFRAILEAIESLRTPAVASG
jgi:hypothetical protein